MEALWTRGPCSVREIQESFPAKKRPAYTTVQTTVYRLEVKKALRRVKKIATALIFEAAMSREAAERRLIDELLSLFGGRSRPIMAHLVDSGKLTLEDVRVAEKALLKTSKRTNRNESGLAVNCGSSVAIDSLREYSRSADSCITREWGSRAALDLGRGIMEISHPDRHVDGAGKSRPVAHPMAQQGRARIPQLQRGD
jgi:predicted transcriptional regulator